MKLWLASAVLLSVLVVGCHGPVGRSDPFTPALAVSQTNDFTGKPGIAYRFTEEQRTRMAHTNLETNRFLVYLERRWPLKRLQAYCVPAREHSDLWQNLVPVKTVLEADLYQGEVTGFDKVWVYVSQDDGDNTTYFEDAGRNWHRWEYSLNIKKADHYWVIIEQLPNDFMDSPKYAIDGKHGSANRSRPVGSERNRTPAAVGSGG